MGWLRKELKSTLSFVLKKDDVFKCGKLAEGSKESFLWGISASVVLEGEIWFGSRKMRHFNFGKLEGGYEEYF